MLAVVDILVLRNEGYCAIEVKSSPKISEAYLQDAALQYFVITGSGLPIAEFSFLHLNKPVDEALQNQEDIFCETPVTDYCREQLPVTSEKVESALKVISEKQMPDVSVGEHCLKPYRCDFYGYCHQELIEPGEQNELPF